MDPAGTDTGVVGHDMDGRVLPIPSKQSGGKSYCMGLWEAGEPVGRVDVRLLG